MKTKQSEINSFLHFSYSFTIFEVHYFVYKTLQLTRRYNTCSSCKRDWRWSKFIYFLFVLISVKTQPLCKYKHHKNVFIIINMIKICYNFLHIRKNIEREKKQPRIKSFVEVRRQKLKATIISEGQMEDNLCGVWEFTKKVLYLIGQKHNLVKLSQLQLINCFYDSYEL